MPPLIGISCSTLVLSGMRGVPRFALAQRYAECVLAAGGLPVMLPNVSPETAEPYLASIDGLLLSGGLDLDPITYGQEPRPDLGRVDQERDRFELELIRRAHAGGMPILGICRGVQVMNVAFGGTLLQHIPAQVEGAIRHEQDDVRWDAVAHGVVLTRGTRLHGMSGGQDAIRVNTFHHQAVGELAEGFVVSARASDGVVEGIEDPAHPFCVGVQWHPERRPDDPATRGLFDGFLEAVEAARARRALRQGPAARASASGR